MKPETRSHLIRILIILGVVALTIYLVSIREEIQKFKALGYPGIFLVSLLSSATVFVPLPGVLFTSAMGAVYNPFGVALAASLGSALGELSGYLAGFSGQKVASKVGFYARLEELMKKYGDVIIFLLAFIPNPAFDTAGISAGVLKMPPYRFLFWCWAGKMVKMLVFAYGGSAILQLFGL